MLLNFDTVLQSQMLQYISMSVFFLSLFYAYDYNI